MKRYFKYISIALFSIFCSFSAFSADLSTDSVCASLSQKKVTYGDFAQEKTSAKLSKPLKSTGSFVFCDSGIVWNTVKPFKTTTVIKKNSIVQTAANGKKSVIDGSTNEMFKSVAATVSSIFNGNKSALETYFNITKFESDASTWKMVLAPKDKTISSALNQIELSGAYTPDGNAFDCSMDEMKILQNDSNTTKYSLMNQKYSQELSNEQRAHFE